MSSISVFIYGTLLPDQSNHAVVAAYAESYRPGQIVGCMVDCGDYPALVRDQTAKQRTSIIIGLWIAVDRAGLAAMDVLEEFHGIEEANDYERIWVSDAEDISLAGWVYIWESCRGIPVLEDAYWPDFYARKKAKEN
ncbi:gamma-glutamylcyclotransferase family protein [Paenibacillus luteus]|uniref:gamma-glutamylcyclotransferase family protein n=1 Tax=Paenibacillus luteus TaxID=2545753 RepID=UPI0011425BF6|nr:gamma-glutamylcyclotransferase family protein [Paenibacillus luteus]